MALDPAVLYPGTLRSHCMIKPRYRLVDSTHPSPARRLHPATFLRHVHAVRFRATIFAPSFRHHRACHSSTACPPSCLQQMPGKAIPLPPSCCSDQARKTTCKHRAFTRKSSRKEHAFFHAQNTAPFSRPFSPQQATAMLIPLRRWFVAVLRRDMRRHWGSHLAPMVRRRPRQHAPSRCPRLSCRVVPRDGPRVPPARHLAGAPPPRPVRDLMSQPAGRRFGEGCLGDAGGAAEL